MHVSYRVSHDKKMSFKPNEEQLFNYHLGVSDPQLTRQIENYLETHPEIRNRLNQFDDIENHFKKFPVTEPSEKVVERVREMAHKEAKPRFFAPLQKISWQRGLAWSFMLVMVVGLSYTLSELRESTPYSNSFIKPKISNDHHFKIDNEKAANFSGILTEKLIKPVDVNNKADKNLNDFAMALSFYHQSRFKEASELFGQIIKSEPLFSKRLELYNYWILSLDKMGDTAMAQEKRLELMKIQQEMTGQETM